MSVRSADGRTMTTGLSGLGNGTFGRVMRREAGIASLVEEESGEGHNLIWSRRNGD
jgi:hypothetical protein